MKFNAPSVDSVEQLIDARRFKVFLLGGITGHAVVGRACGQLLDRLPQQRNLVFLRRSVVDQTAHVLAQGVVVLRHAIGGEAHF